MKPKTDSELLIRIDERLRSLSDKLDAFMESVKANYVDKVEFESWKSSEFAPIKQIVDESVKFKALFVGAIVSGIGSLLFSLFKK